MHGEIARDLNEAPHAFDVLGAVALSRLRDWAAEQSRPIPDDLIELWALTGGGDAFETEEIFSPLAGGDHDIDGANRELWTAGLPDDLLAFHSGIYLTALDPAGRIVRVDPDTLQPVGTFDSIDDWYSDLRREYARTYGLPEARSR